MNGVVQLQHLGRFGNNLFAYAFARAYAEKHNCAFRTDPWEGEQIFDIAHERPQERLPMKDENTLVDGDVNFTYRSYSQCQRCVGTYTRAQVRQWLKFKPHIADALGVLKPEELLAHQRLTDYRGYQFPCVSRQSYLDACDEFGLDKSKLTFVSDEHPTHLPGPWPDFLPDFWRLCHAKVLLRGNSSFSWWAAVLSDADVYAPIIEGKPGGAERDYPFVHSNHPRFNTQGFLTDLHMPEN